MALNQKEAQMLDRYIRATQAARAFLEPHPSWKRNDLRREALIAIRNACGGSPGMDDFYREVIGGEDE